MNPEWKELKNRTLPERVAEILENLDHEGSIIGQPTAAFACKVQAEKIAKALRTGDTTEIEGWVKK